MFELLRTWLNGPKKFNEGVVLYQSTIGNDAFFALLLKGETPFNRKKLDEVLMKKYLQLKSEQVNEPVKVNVEINPLPDKKEPPKQAVNNELYQSCKAEADLLYKEVMNKRAVLFGMTKVEEYQDPNSGTKPRERSQLAIWVVVNFNRMSQLYDRAAFVKEHGHLPETDITSIDEEYNELPEVLLKQTIDNLRKNINKMKKRPETPERIELLQKHTTNLLKLEAKWHSYKQA